MHKPLVGVLVGSRADFNIMRRGLETLRVMGVPYRFEMASAHRTPDRVVRFAQMAGEEGIEIIICAAGGSANVAGMLAAYTTLPIIAVPIDTTPLRGQDALHSMVQQPPGTPVATVGINNGENAAFLAASILALKHPRYREVLAHQRALMRQRLEASQNELHQAFPDLCDPLKTAAARATTIDTDADTDPGSEGDTPEAPTREKERIQPGALFVHRTGSGGATNGDGEKTGGLVRTPAPQEPANITEDAEVRAEILSPTPPAPAAPEAFPTPPADEDLAPTARKRRDSAAPPAKRVRAVPSEAETQVQHKGSPAIDIDKLFIDTKVFRIDHEDPDEDVLSHTMMVLLEGGIVAFPTDTVYGLAVDATNPEAVRALYEVKGHDAQRKSLSVLIHSSDLLDTLVKEVPGSIESVMEIYWPGGLTILFSKHPDVLSSVSDSPSIAIRIPDDPIPIRLMEMIQRPLAVISASLHASAPAVDAGRVIERFEGKIHCILDAGMCRSGDTSTVLSVITEPYEILREGVVPTRDLKKILGDKMKE